MLQVKSLILNFFLLVLGIPLDFGPDAGHKSGRFSKILYRKSLKFVLSKKNDAIAFNLDFVLLPAEVDLIPEK